MKEVFVIRDKNDKNGNPIYLIDLNYYPECKELGKPKRNASWLRRFSSYNLEDALKKYFNKPIQVNVIKL